MDEVIRIGIVGSDNSHAQRFPELTNLQETPENMKVKGIKVVAIFGLEKARTEEVAKAAQIPEIVEKPEDMLGKVDAVMVVFRHGGLHYQYAKPFLKNGLPVFVDKPFCAASKDCEKMVELAEKHNALLTSYSTLRFADSYRKFKEEMKGFGEIVSGLSKSPADRNSEYGGLVFYGIHATELMEETFGLGVTEVTARENGDDVVATCGYQDGKLVSLFLLKNAVHNFHLVVYGKEKWGSHEIDAGTCYRDGLLKFQEMIKTGQKPLEYKQMIEPVLVIEAIEKSLKKGKTVKLA